MSNSEIINTFFMDTKRTHYDFSQAPTLIRLKSGITPAVTGFQGAELARWQKAQNILLRWTTDRQIFTQEYVAQGKAIYENFFQQRGFLQGNVLDIGGGWGLYRQWWSAGATNYFIVHDPGVERFLQGAHELHHRLYARAFELPMTFVEGFGEELPYQAETFDTGLVASALDHCVSPAKVFAGIYRCLKPGGTLLVLQQCQQTDVRVKSVTKPLHKRLTALLQRPGHLFAVLRTRLFYKEPHLHHFVVDQLVALLKETNFAQVNATVVPNTGHIYAFEARK